VWPTKIEQSSKISLESRYLGITMSPRYNYKVSWHALFVQLYVLFGSGGGRSGTMGERSPGCFFSVLPKGSIPKPAPLGKEMTRVVWY